jgi:hypothetical protein
MHFVASDTVHVPVVPPSAETTHLAGGVQPGPTVGSVEQEAPSAAGATHVPMPEGAPASVTDFTHVPPPLQSAKPVMGAAPMSPHGCPAATSWIAWHVPTELPFAVGTHTSPMLP